MLKLYNTTTRLKQIFKPLDSSVVKMYVCGPTVYDYPHIGNARAVVVYDILYRILRYLYSNNSVLYVRNITDVDDKIIDRARELNIPINKLTNNVINYFHAHMQYLNCLPPAYEPKATKHIGEMINIIKLLMDQGFAYMVGSSVYFEVSKYHNYTELSNRSLEEMSLGARIAIDQNKKQPHDFVLWKAAEDQDAISSNFASPWGIGRPGWHIECSAMSHKYLGENFDIHGGGADLIFPHHTNEIAQSKCAFQGSNFANFWVHNGFLTVNGEKMSKSLGNFITVKDLIEKEIPGEVIRLFLISGNYRHPLDYNNKAIMDCHKMLDYWYKSLDAVEIKLDDAEITQDFKDALFDDMNTPLAIKIINDLAKKIYHAKDRQEKESVAKDLIANAQFIGLLNSTPSEWFKNIELTAEIEHLLNLRKIAKEQKDWKQADEIRSQLLAQNIQIEDHADGSITAKKLTVL